MYDISKRKQFSTVGELKQLLENYSDNTQIVVTGDDYCWFHVEQDESVICLDVEDLEECYEEEYVPSSENGDYGPCNPWDAPGMSVRDFI